MKNRLLARYIIVFFCTLLVCTLVLGVALLYFSAQSFSSEKHLVLRTASEQAVEKLRDGLSVSDGTLVLDDGMQTVLQDIGGTTGTVVFVTDRGGSVVLCSEGDDCVHASRVGQKILNAAVQRGWYADTGYTDALFGRRAQYLFSLPIEQGGETVGFVFATSPLSPLVAFLFDLLVTFLVSTGTMLVASAVIIYYATRRLTQPLREISAAANRFGSGDFEARVAFEGGDEIGQVAAAFNDMADSLSEFERSRRSFVANVSHELRTPMTTIGGYIDGMLDGTIPPERWENYLGIVSDEVKRLSRLTTSLLNISRMEEGQEAVTLSNFNAWDVVLSVMWSAEKRIVEKGIEVPDLDVNARFVMADEDMLHQVVYNLVDNAIKFTPENGVISVSIEPEGDMTVLRIRNTGEGIAPEELGHIFERFYKTDKSRGLDRTGTGLGLYIVRTLVGRMGGVVSVTSEQGQYTEFAVSLPTGTAGKVREHRVRRRTREERAQDEPVTAEPPGKAERKAEGERRPALLVRLSSPFWRRGGKK